MGRIVTEEDAKAIAEEFHKQNKRIILAGGCFDLLHIGHITFLEKAKQQGALISNGYNMLCFQADEAWKIWNQ